MSGYMKVCEMPHLSVAFAVLMPAGFMGQEA
jgi:hypothetical protein